MMQKSSAYMVALAVSLFGANASDATDTLHVMKTSGCGCCIGWIKHMEANGFAVAASNLPMGVLMQEKLAAGLKLGLTSCHTGKIGGYVVEGHVPAQDVRRLLAERPDAAGLTVPDMPVGSPGMEGGRSQAFDVLLLRRDGTTEIFARYPAGGS